MDVLPNRVSGAGKRPMPVWFSEALAMIVFIVVFGTERLGSGGWQRRTVP